MEHLSWIAAGQLVGNGMNVACIGSVLAWSIAYCKPSPVSLLQNLLLINEATEDLRTYHRGPDIDAFPRTVKPVEDGVVVAIESDQFCGHRSVDERDADYRALATNLLVVNTESHLTAWG